MDQIITYPNSKTRNEPHNMEFLPDGKILWEMTTQDKNLRLAGDYTFIDNNTIKVDFVRYSTSTVIGDIACSSPSPPRDSITISNCTADDVIATMKRVY